MQKVWRNTFYISNVILTDQVMYNSFIMEAWKFNGKVFCRYHRRWSHSDTNNSLTQTVDKWNTTHWLIDWLIDWARFYVLYACPVVLAIWDMYSRSKRGWCHIPCKQSKQNKHQYMCTQVHTIMHAHTHKHTHTHTHTHADMCMHTHQPTHPHSTTYPP